jgi:hypothetical protein
VNFKASQWLKAAGVQQLIYSALCLLIILYLPLNVFALHPLITEDAGVQEKGKTEIEIGTELASESEDGTITKTSSLTTTLTYGLNDSMDLILGIPYHYIRTKTSGLTSNEEGIADIVTELKWRFYEKEGLSLALKPGIALPTGDKKRGLGNGRTAYGLYFITTKEINPLTLHLNLQYKRNENRKEPSDRIDLWHISLASELKATKKLRFVANVGMDKNTNKASNVDPAFVLGGLVYSISEGLDFDIGYKHGLNKPANDYSLLAGITWRG